MIIREHQNKVFKRPYELTAALNLSGTTVTVGVLSEEQEDCIFIMTDENSEPVFMSPSEADLLIASLTAAKGQMQ